MRTVYIIVFCFLAGALGASSNCLAFGKHQVVYRSGHSIVRDGGADAWQLCTDVYWSERKTHEALGAISRVTSEILRLAELDVSSQNTEELGQKVEQLVSLREKLLSAVPPEFNKLNTIIHYDWYVSNAKLKKAINETHSELLNVNLSFDRASVKIISETLGGFPIYNGLAPTASVNDAGLKLSLDKLVSPVDACFYQIAFYTLLSVILIATDGTYHEIPVRLLGL